MRARISVQLYFVSIFATSLILCALSKDPLDFAANQLLEHNTHMNGPGGILSTDAGSPVESRDATDTLNTNLIENEYLLDSITRMNRERIPERVVHAKGAGAFGYFKVTHDISRYCKADFLNGVGKKTPIVVRFSQALISDRGSADTSRDARGFAIKCYTNEGNMDFLGLNTPIFFFRDPVLFSSLGHSEKRNPVSNVYDRNAYWDFKTMRPEQFFMMLFLFSDGGIPASYRYMDGFPIHTFELENGNGKIHYARFNFISDQGTKNLLSEDAQTISGTDGEYLTRDLYNAIANHSYPSWTVYIQVMTQQELINAKFDPFSVLKIWPRALYPYKPVGKLVLTRNPANYFAEIEQVAFSPGNLVPGILGAPDVLFQARKLAYKDAHYHRLGPNFMQIPVNCPLTKYSGNYNRDGSMTIDNLNGKPNYHPNSFFGPEPYVDVKRNKESSIGKLVPREIVTEDLFQQATEFYLRALDESERRRLVENISSSLRDAAQYLQKKALDIFSHIHPDLAHRIARALSSNTTQVGYDKRMEPISSNNKNLFI